MTFDDGQTISVSHEMVDALRQRFVTASLRQRVATTVWVQMLAINLRYGIDFLSMVQPILDLENGTNLSGTKRPTPFAGEPLRGLWHKHYFCARFLAGNILAGLGKRGMREILIDVMGEPDGSRVATEDDMREVVRRIVEEPISRRTAQGTRTGEWIIYLPRPDGNYYLSLGEHNTPDERLIRRIEAECTNDFPDLMKWVAEARRA